MIGPVRPGLTPFRPGQGSVDFEGCGHKNVSDIRSSGRVEKAGNGRGRFLASDDSFSFRSVRDINPAGFFLSGLSYLLATKAIQKVVGTKEQA
jgi:hypothetical protein